MSKTGLQLISRFVVVAVLAFTLVAQLANAQPATITPDEIAQIIASPDRSAADRNNDLRRKPEQMLAFIGIRPGIVAFDLSAAGGYTTELLARSVGPAGKVYGQSRPPFSSPPPPPAAPEGNSHPTTTTTTPPPPNAPQPSPVALEQRNNNLAKARIPAAPIVAVVRVFEDPFPSDIATSAVDLVTLMFNYHDLGHLGVNRSAMNKAVFAALKPGGSYVIADHSGRAGTGISEIRHAAPGRGGFPAPRGRSGRISFGGVW